MNNNEAPLPDHGPAAVLHLLCGRIAAGKSTLATSLARQHNAVLIGEDHWLALLYGDQIQSFKDYRHYAVRLRELVTPHCVDLLKRGVNVVLDFPANTPQCRRWLKSIVAQAQCRHVLHYLTTSKQTCKAQLRQRIATDDSNRTPIALAEFEAINRYFVPPDVSEGFNVDIIR